MSKATKTCEDFDKWNYMMNWCRDRRLPPKDFWDIAEKAYEEMIKNAKPIELNKG